MKAQVRMLLLVAALALLFGFLALRRGNAELARAAGATPQEVTR
ncbi:MAG TPA: hypothetical protein VLS93_05595 [Anaeromyxobacteraceae bacterium]|nr:hypothetical protein [Anaeromyxobacteraceae bacterium]